MLKTVASLGLLFASSALFAAPVMFTSAEYFADVVAGVGAEVAVDSATVDVPSADPLIALPALASVNQAGANDGDDSAADALAERTWMPA